MPPIEEYGWTIPEGHKPKELWFIKFEPLIGDGTVAVVPCSMSTRVIRPGTRENSWTSKRQDAMNSESHIGLQESMAELIGRAVSSIEFVQDYMQFRFDGPCLTTLTLPSVRIKDGVLTLGAPGYRDALCGLLGKSVKRVEVTDDELALVFGDQASLVVSLRHQDYRGPEAINYVTESGKWVVV